MVLADRLTFRGARQARGFCGAKTEFSGSWMRLSGERVSWRRNERDQIHTDASAGAGAAGADEESFAAAGFGFQHVQHGWNRRVSHDSFHTGGAAGATGAAWLAGGRTACDLRRDDLVRTGGRAAGLGWKLSLLARNVWAAALGAPAG